MTTAVIETATAAAMENETTEIADLKTTGDRHTKVSLPDPVPNGEKHPQHPDLPPLQCPHLHLLLSQQMVMVQLLHLLQLSLPSMCRP